MNGVTRPRFLAICTVTAGLLSGPAFAFEDAAPASPAAGWQVATPGELAAARARGVDESTLIVMEATSSGNSFEDGTSIQIIGAGNATIDIDTTGGGAGGGSNLIDNSAFSGMNGLSNVVLNNGDGAIIQTGIAVNVTVTP